MGKKKVKEVECVFVFCKEPKPHTHPENYRPKAERPKNPYRFVGRWHNC
jgi:hypothetical protein